MRAAKIVRVALGGAILFVSQVMLSGIPNCELVSLLVVVMTLVYGKEVMLTTIVFSMLEMMLYGMGTWVVMYFYVWPILVIVVLLLKPVVKKSFSMWAVVSGGFGLVFGALCSLIYIPINVSFAFSYWISGLPWDVWHGFTNFVLMILLGKVLYVNINKVSSLGGR